MSDMIFRIHPTINFARVGTSEDYYIAPETAAGTLVDPDTGLMGGLPIKKGTEDTPIAAGDFREAAKAGDDRDDVKKVKRQAARFRVYAYPAGKESYPNGGGVEVQIGARVGDRTVKDIVWTVHVANKKANFYAISTPVKGECVKRDESGKCVKKVPLKDADGNFIHCTTYAPDGGCPDDEYSVKQELGIAAYDNGLLPPARNFTLGADLNDTKRLETLMIDPGPRAIASSTGGAETLHFRAPTKDAPATWADTDGKVHAVADYPSSFPHDHFKMLDGLGTIDTLGEVTIEEKTGRLLVLGGYGRAGAMLNKDGTPPVLEDAIDNDGWFDDTSDGPVNAVLVFDDGSTAQVHGAWVVTTDPSYAPQTRNVVSTWDDMFDAWVRRLQLMPDLYKTDQNAEDGSFQESFTPSFDDDVMPIFHGAMLQQWNTSLPSKGVNGHKIMGAITPATDPKRVIPDLDMLIRDPNTPSQADTGVRMPLALGDAQRSFLEVTPTQHFFLKLWHVVHSPDGVPTVGAGERLDRVVLENCLGGRYSPGIDLTFIVRQPDLYVQEWRTVGCGPFRINQQPLDYSTAETGTPLLGVGWVPLRNSPGVQPGDLSKFMALPWHTDYNSCATHTPDPNPHGNNTLYWSWPAQRPVNVYPAEYCTYDAEEKKWYLGGQVYSIRGTEKEGIATPYPQQQGRYQCYFDFVENWEKVGFIIQGLRIPAPQGENYGAENFLEVASGFKSEGDIVQPWPTAQVDGYKEPECGPPGARRAKGD